MMTGAAESRPENAKLAVQAQNAVLRLFEQAEGSMGKGEVSQAAAGILPSSKAFARDRPRTWLHRQGQSGDERKLPEAIVDRQDKLSQDMEAMIGYCTAEAKQDHNDANFCALMTNIATKAVSLKPTPRWETSPKSWTRKNSPSPAAQQTVTNGIALLMDDSGSGAKPTHWRKKRTRSRSSKTAFGHQKNGRLQANVVDALRGTGGQGDKTEKTRRGHARRRLPKLKANMANAMRKSPPTSSRCRTRFGQRVGHRRIQTFEEMKQETGSGTNAVVETGFRKKTFSRPPHQNRTEGRTKWRVALREIRQRQAQPRKPRQGK
jgi:hypothetical protein